MGFASGDDPEAFEFFLADRLRRSVAELRASMTVREFLGWQAWHALRAQQEELAMKEARRGGR